MARFKFIGNENVILEFHDDVDIMSTRQHPEYVEIDKDGKEIGKRSDGTRPAWDIPMKPTGKKSK